MLQSLFILGTALFLIVKGAMLATRYAVRLAEEFGLSKYTVGLMVVAVISILPETFVAINSSLEGIPEFGLGTLFGSNVADLTLVFAILVALAGKGIRVEKKILKSNRIYPFLFLIPVLMGLNGNYSRVEGAVLIIAGIIFYYFELKNGLDNSPPLPASNGSRLKNFLLLLLSMALLLLGSHFTVSSASDLARLWGVSPVLIGMLIVGIGTTIPELLFSLQAIQQKNNSLAIGDILGTVLADATIVVGLLALIAPFSFPKKIIYISGLFMLAASFTLSRFLRTGRILSKKEAAFLLLFWIAFALSEYWINQ